MVKSYEASGKEIPQNKDISKDSHQDKILRELDCAVIEFMHSEIETQIIQDMSKMTASIYKPFDSTRGVFTEGGEAFTGSGISAKSHIQVCIRNPNCIKGFFLPRNEVDFGPFYDAPDTTEPSSHGSSG